MNDDKKWVESHSDRVLLETILQNQIVLLAHLNRIEKDLNIVKTKLDKTESIYPPDAISEEELYDTVSDLESDLKRLDQVEIDLPIQSLRSRD